ncbi:TetR family transcriptional regulator [Novosphingobium sp. PhB57]|jgi:AcrR family transcriptional regulator|uniref:TetR/AcrR family transcriptional regulator n=1 Tax=unclassified Novosphingobium TaxID=2644732 RepID=UPI00104D9028|nr:TetR/AcrR family transcriptional regulator [Novosphingobium sp. PhB57]TCU57509.1 TetR family transcriptional regulator [Novosphingobium sp. PhB57]
MTRLTRSESQALTRLRLLKSARELFRRDGYAVTSVDRIAEAAGYSKGAVYSNFEGKEAIFLAVLESESEENLRELLARLEKAEETAEIVTILADWADERSRFGGWSLTILEHARVAQGKDSLRRQEEIVRGQWRKLGSYLLGRFPGCRAAPEQLGALLFEIAFAPALTFVSAPRAGDLVRLALPPLLPG